MMAQWVVLQPHNFHDLFFNSKLGLQTLEFCMFVPVGFL